MQTWITSAILKQALANMLHLEVASLGKQWDQIVADSNQSAFLDIRGILIMRGYTAQQVMGWDRGPEFQRDIGLFWCLVKGAGLHPYDDRFIKQLDRREEIRKPGFLVEINGITTNMNNQPQPIAGGVMCGTLPTSPEYWAGVCHWGWPGRGLGYDTNPPYPPGTGYIG